MPCIYNPLSIILPLAAAVVFDILAGEYPALVHPVVWMGKYISRIVEHADQGKSRISRFFSGMLMVLSGFAVFVFPAAVMFGVFINAAPGSAGWAVLLIIIAFTIKSTFSISALYNAGKIVADALDNDDVQEARILTSTHLVSRNTTSLTPDEVSAAVIESLSENFTDSFMSPWCFMAVGGPAAAVGYRFVNTCDSMIGYRTEKFEWFGKFAARLDDALNFIPARLGGFIICTAAAFLKGYSGGNAFRTMFSEHRVTESPNAGWTMAAAAGALGVKLVKHGHYAIAGGPNLPSSIEIRKALKLLKAATGISGIIFMMILFLAGVGVI